MGWKPANTRRRARRAGRRGAHGDVPLDPLARFIALGLPVVPAAAPRDGGCSCDRIGCPTPAAHPLSRAWQSEASADPEQLERWRARHPEANYMSPTGRTHDVLDVDSTIGEAALQRLLVARAGVGPVAQADGRHLFFTAPRVNLDADDLDEEWWSSELDCRPETLDEHPDLRWHNRGSYVPVPPSTAYSGRRARWVYWPVDGAAPPSTAYSGRRARWVYWPVDGAALPDAVVVLEVLADLIAERQSA